MGISSAKLHVKKTKNIKERERERKKERAGVQSRAFLLEIGLTSRSGD